MVMQEILMDFGKVRINQVNLWIFYDEMLSYLC